MLSTIEKSCNLQLEEEKEMPMLMLSKTPGQVVAIQLHALEAYRSDLEYSWGLSRRTVMVHRYLLKATNDLPWGPTNEARSRRDNFIMGLGFHVGFADARGFSFEELMPCLRNEFMRVVVL
jgi:hypothetical protein